MAEAVADKLKALKGGSLLAAGVNGSNIPALVFLSPAGQPQHRKTVLERTNDLMKSAAISQVGFHALRHTCASILINRGADALRVQRQLGHSNVRMTLDTYSHLFEERLKENVDLLEQAFRV
jgi:site-specific recombinase XerD